MCTIKKLLYAVLFFLFFIPSAFSQLKQLQADLLKDSLNKTDKELLQILKTDFRSDWFYAKDVLLFDRWPEGPVTEKLHLNSLDFMNDLVQMRIRVWKSFASQTQNSFNDYIKMKAVMGSGPVYPLVNTNNNLVIEDGSGSTSVTSDIDISLKGKHTELAVAFIDSVFKDYFETDREPGSLFDINVYAADWMHGDKEIKGEPNVVTYLPLSEVQLLTNTIPSALLTMKMDDQEEMWSYVHILRNMKPEEWKNYTNTILESAGSKSLDDLIIRFDNVEEEFIEFKTAVANAFDIAIANRAVQDHYDEDAVLMRVSNRLYEKRLIEVKQDRLDIENNIQTSNWNADVEESLVLELRNDISRALTYANEVYSTEGAVLHTVKGKQGAQSKLKKLKDPNSTSASEYVNKENVEQVKYVLRPSQYIQSVNENLGDVLHSLNHYADDPAYAVYRAGKYLNRLCEAAAELLGTYTLHTLPEFEKLNEIGLKSVEEKDATKAGGDPMYVRNEQSFFNNINKEFTNDIRAMTITLGAAIVANYYTE